ncbi:MULTISPECIES: hypothetical protein [Sporosarcina]|uniref:hypothetical protein n=1 Tax=Sporosarcina TaxID=1569 RepID=UPI000AED7508|nr:MULTISPECIES: hypothetical protein [Sporosarcina]WJY27232.1 hypothetical protein QWT68_14520 [Sporosarcina sp. 0.2-SM1T-5]
MSQRVLMAIAGVIVGWLIVSSLTKGFDTSYLIGILFGFLAGYVVRKEAATES